MTMRQLIVLGLALAGVMHANDAEEHEDDGAFEEEGAEEPEDDVPGEPLSEETLRALFKKIDKDGDGKVAQSELLAFAKHMRSKTAAEFHEQTWEDSDQDKDGKISLAELMVDSETEHEENTKVTFEAADADGDGFLDKEESFAFTHMESSHAVEHAIAKFEMKLNDKDGDDKLNSDEFAELYGAADDGDGEDGQDPEAEQEMQKFAKEVFEHLDHDKDGFLDVTEMQAYESGRHHEEHSLTKMARHADEDGDGFITVQELLNSVNSEDAEEHLYNLEGWAADLEL